MQCDDRLLAILEKIHNDRDHGISAIAFHGYSAARKLLPAAVALADDLGMKVVDYTDCDPTSGLRLDQCPLSNLARAGKRKTELRKILEQYKNGPKVLILGVQTEHPHKNPDIGTPRVYFTWPSITAFCTTVTALLNSDLDVQRLRDLDNQLQSVIN